jgi:predicted acetyltransferase
MHYHLAVRAVDLPDDIDQLRTWLQNEAGDAATHALDQHLARPRARPGFTLLAAQPDGAIAGAAFLRHERLRLGAAVLETGMLALYGAAGRHAAGIAALLDAALQVLHEQGLPLLLLHGTVTQFGSFGFAPCMFQHTTTLNAGTPGARVAPLVYTLRQEALPNDSDVDDLAALYDASYQDQPLSQVRATPDWRAWLAEQRDVIMVEDRQRRLGGYACVTTHADSSALHVHETAAADAGAARALLQVLAEQAHVGGHRAVLLALPPTHVVARAAIHSGGEARTRAAYDDEATMLAGVVDLAALLDMLGPALTERLRASRYAGWRGTVQIETEAERVALAAAGNVTVAEGSQPADVRLRRVTLPACAQLCLGYRSAADLRATGELDCDDQALGLIDILFPVVSF